MGQLVLSVKLNEGGFVCSLIEILKLAAENLLHIGGKIECDGHKSLWSTFYHRNRLVKFITMKYTIPRLCPRSLSMDRLLSAKTARWCFRRASMRGCKFPNIAITPASPSSPPAASVSWKWKACPSSCQAARRR